MENTTDYHYKILLKSAKTEVSKVSQLRKINTFLKENDWLFISPFFFQGIEMDAISKLITSNDNPKDKIIQLISSKFFNLPYTASFIEGYCSRCDKIRPFLMSIEHSLILTFQKDYEGAIKTIIPIIEGIIRKYLVEEKGYQPHSIQFEKIRKSFDLMKLDLISSYFDDIKNYANESKQHIIFSDDQLNKLMAMNVEYYDIWFSFISDFINKSFYLKTTGQPLTNEINRHSILHEFGDKFPYNFENYIKIYFLLQFLTWVFLLKERKSILNEIGPFRFYEKVTSYRAIIKLSEKLIYEKHLLYKNYDNYNSAALKENFRVCKNINLPKTQIIFGKAIKKMAKMMWEKFDVDISQ